MLTYYKEHIFLLFVPYLYFFILLQYGSNYSTPSPKTSQYANNMPMEAQYSTIDMGALSRTSPVRSDDTPSTSSYQAMSPQNNMSSSPSPSSSLSCNGSISSPPLPNGRKRVNNNKACRDSRKKKKVKREGLKDREMELLADNELQRSKIAKLEVEVSKTRDVILKMMAGGSRR